VISVNEQLIGIEQLGVAAPFGYCGNIVPLKTNSTSINRVKTVAVRLGKKLGLVGSNGLDFVIGENRKPYLLEVNPRFQATLECIHYVTGLNLVTEHLKSWWGEVPTQVPQPQGYAIKMIAFAKEKSVVPTLDDIDFIFDISHPGVIVEKGDPICTVQVTALHRQVAVNAAFQTVSKIYRRMPSLTTATSSLEK
jgi:predicted ATP-grasp superfamily ATP-dependent carboligase